MKHIFNKKVAIFGLVFLASSHVAATAITESSLINNAHLDFNNNTYTTTISGVTEFNSQPDVGIATSASFNHGTTGSKAANQTNAVQSLVQMFDTLSFSENTTVSFDFTLDGFLSSNSIFVNPYGSARVDVYDITGLPTWLELDNVFGLFDLVDVRDSAVAITTNVIDFDMDDLNVISDGSRVTTPNTLARDGTVHRVEHTISRSFNVEVGRVYGFRISTNTYNSGVNQNFGFTGFADFNNTSSFAFTDLGGANFTSGSGAFLTANEVSTPTMSALLFLAFLSVFKLRSIRYVHTKQ